MATIASTDLAARILLEATFVAFAASEVIIRVRSTRHREGSRADRGSILAVLLAITTGALLAGWCTSRVPAAAIAGRWVPFVVGLALMWLGIALRGWAVLSLGRFFTVVVRVTDGQGVVDTGPYRWVRHPSYTGLLLTLVGLGLTLGNWLSVLALAAFPTIGLVVRIRVEERALAAALGERYRAYAEGRKRLLPGVW